MKRRNRKRLTLLAGVLALVSLAAAAPELRHQIRIWLKLREDFESLGRQKYKHRETGIVFTRVDESLTSESLFLVGLDPGGSTYIVFWPLQSTGGLELKNWRETFKDPGFSIPMDEQRRQTQQAGYIFVPKVGDIRWHHTRIVYTLR